MPDTPGSDQRAAAPWLALVVALASLGAWVALPTQHVLELTDESGPIENITIALWLAAALAVGACRRRLAGGVAAALAVSMLAFAAREADWHILLTGTSMLRVSYYLGPAPLILKIAALAVVAVLAAGWVHLGIAAVRAWSTKRLHGQALGINLIAFLVVLVLTKALDRALSILDEDFGVAATPTMRALQVAVEEPMEMALPLMVLATLWQAVAHRRATAAPGGSAQLAMLDRTTDG